jgi:hypothetical protein
VRLEMVGICRPLFFFFGAGQTLIINNYNSVEAQSHVGRPHSGVGVRRGWACIYPPRHH